MKIIGCSTCDDSMSSGENIALHNLIGSVLTS
jgi:hypothetical protein